MRHEPRLRTPIVGILALLLAIILPACGGGGSNSEGTATGGVALLVTDASVEDFTSIRITVTQVGLLRDGEETILWDGPAETIDLLELSGHSEIFAVSTDVPAGDYDKIRLHVDADSLTLVPAPAEDYRLPGGKIDLNPKGQFTVVGGETLVVELDFDASKTLAVSRGGIFRPVIFVNVLGDGDPAEGDAGKIVRVRGQIDGVSAAGFVLCHPTVASADYCVDVAVGAGTSVFKDVDGSLALAGVLSTDAGATAVAYGLVDLAAESLDGLVVEIGPTFLQRPIKGVVDAVGDGTISFTVLDGQGEVPEGSLAVDASLTRLFDCAGEEIAATALEGLEARLDGVYRDAAGLDAAILIAKTCAQDDLREGTVVSKDPVLLRATIRLQEEAQVCAQFREGSEIFTEAKAAGGGYELTRIDFADLGLGWEVRLFGAPGDGECFDVDTAFGEPPSP